LEVKNQPIKRYAAWPNRTAICAFAGGEQRFDLARTAAASIDRTMALTGPTAAGVIEKLLMPIPISAIASSGQPAISARGRYSACLRLDRDDG
jgi:hypothetical protein